MVNNWNDVSPGNLIIMFTNIVSLVALQLRSKGHHYTPGIEARYDELFKEMNRLVTANGQPWQMAAGWASIAGTALHAIPSVVLDNFWLWSKRRSRCAAILGLRM